MSQYTSRYRGDDDIYRFTIVNNQVIRAEEFDDGHWELEDLDANEIYVVQNGDVLKIEYKKDYSEVTRYSDTDRDGLYIEVSEFRTDAPPISPSPWNDQTPWISDNQPAVSLHGDLYKFSITHGIVHGVMEYDDGIFKHEHIDSNEFYTVQGHDVIKTEWKWGGQEITRYSDQDGDGLFIEISEQWIPDLTLQAANAPVPVSAQELVFQGTEHNDFVTVRATKAPAIGGQGADAFVVRDWGHVTIADFSRLQGDMIVFDTGYGIRSVDQFAQTITDLHWQGDDLFVGLGTQASLTLIGVGSQGSIDLENIYVLS